MGKINDFGKVIEGARKDLWKSRGLMVEDTTGMTDLEKEKYVTKDNIWIKPDVNQLLEVFPREIVYWKMEMRKLVAAKPIQITIEEYIEGVRTIRDMVAHVTTEAEIYAFASEAKNGKLLIQTGRYQYDYVKPYRNILKGNAFLRLNTEYGLRQMKRKMDEKNFGLNENAIMQKDYPILYVDGDKIGIGLDRGRKMLVQSVPTGKYFFYPQEGISLDDVEEKYVLLNKMRRIIFVGTTSDECEAERKTIFEQQSSEKGNKERPNKKKKWIPKQFENLKRIGNEQHFPGHQVTGEEIIEIFGIRGGQFGNWTNNLERQHSLNYTFDAFADLAEVLGIERTSISLPGLSRGGLGLAFGARGRGDAVAHYEPIQEVINITKLRGAGSLGHEWSHALDHLIAQKYHLRGFASESFHGSQAVPDTFHKVMDCIYWDENGNRTIYLRNSKLFDGMYSSCGHGYWTSPCELFARAFSCYLTDKFKEKGMRNDYLNGHSESYTFGPIHAYPLGEERTRINQAIDALIEDLKKKEIFIEAKPVRTSNISVKKPKAVSQKISYNFKVSQNGQFSFI